MNSAWKHIQRKLLAGLLVVVPVVAALWVLWTLFQWVDGFLAPAIWRWVDHFWGNTQILGFTVGGCKSAPCHALVDCTGPKCKGPPGAGFITTLLLIYVTGALATNFLGRRVVGWLDSVFVRFPFIGGIYTAVKQLLQSISNTSSSSFKRVVLVEFPVAGNWTVGFVTGELSDSKGHEFLSVFVATAPNPTTGFAMVVRKERALPTSMTVEEGFKFLMSAGVVRPRRLSDEPFPDPVSAGTPAEPGALPDVLEEVVEK